MPMLMPSSTRESTNEMMSLPEHGSIKCTAKRMDDNGGSSEIDEKRRHLSGAGICHELIFVTDCTDTDEQKHDGNQRV